MASSEMYKASSMLKEHDCGIFIDTNQNIEEIKRDFCCALTRLIKDAGLRERLGLNGKDFANANLTWEQKFKHIYARWDQVIKEGAHENI